MRVTFFLTLFLAIGIVGCSDKHGDKKAVFGTSPDGKPEDKIVQMPKRDPAKEEKLEAERKKRRERLAAHEKAAIPALAKAHPAEGIQGAIARLGDKSFYEVTFSSDGKLAATTADQDIYVWDLGTGTTWRKLSVARPWDLRVRFGKDRTLVALAGDRDYKKSTIIVWDVESQKVLKKIERNSSLGILSISPDGKRLAVGNGSLAVRDHPVDILDVETLAVKRTLPPVRHLGAIAFSPCGKFLATGGRTQVILRNAVNGDKFGELKTSVQVDNLAFSPDGWTLMISEHDPYEANVRIIVWNLESSKQEKLLELEQIISSLDYSPDGRFLAVIQPLGKQSAIRNARTGVVVQGLPGRPGVFSPGGQLFVVPDFGLVLYPVNEKKKGS
jgi:WD40 repeat protein